VWHGFHQIRKTGTLKLFKSHKEGIADGEQQRDFIYVRDVTDVCTHFMKNDCPNGLYNVGTGEARSFRDLGLALFAAMEVPVQIEYIPTPENIRDTYQYFTEAEMRKLREAGYRREFTPLETGVANYVQGFLLTGESF
jgi:ADP-L-glycero-D-manno-heptose 6-epimerase